MAASDPAYGQAHTWTGAQVHVTLGAVLNWLLSPNTAVQSRGHRSEAEAASSAAMASSARVVAYGATIPSRLRPPTTVLTDRPLHPRTNLPVVLRLETDPRDSGKVRVLGPERRSVRLRSCEHHTVRKRQFVI